MKIRRILGAALAALSISVGAVAVDSAPVAAASAAPTAPVVLAGQFCKNVDVGKIVTADNGKTVICRFQSGHNRWVIK